MSSDIAYNSIPHSAPSFPKQTSWCGSFPTNLAFYLALIFQNHQRETLHQGRRRMEPVSCTLLWWRSHSCICQLGRAGYDGEMSSDPPVAIIVIASAMSRVNHKWANSRTLYPGLCSSDTFYRHKWSTRNYSYFIRRGKHPGDRIPMFRTDSRSTCCWNMNDAFGIV